MDPSNAPDPDGEHYQWETNCVGSDGESIREMVDAEEEISRQAFARRIGKDNWKWIQGVLGYDRDFPISGDWHIGYCESAYRGRPCVFLRWSGIEYIFVEPTALRHNPEAISPATLLGQLVKVHYNLHRCPGGERAGSKPGESCFVVSTKQGGSWKVAGYVSNLLLEDVEFKVSEAGVRSIRNKGQRAVVAWFIGTVVDQKKHKSNFGDWDGVKFNPFKAWTFVLENGEPIDGAPLVYLSGRKAMAKLRRSNPPSRVIGERVHGHDELELLADVVGGSVSY